MRYRLRTVMLELHCRRMWRDWPFWPQNRKEWSESRVRCDRWPWNVPKTQDVRSSHEARRHCNGKRSSVRRPGGPSRQWHTMTWKSEKNIVRKVTNYGELAQRWRRLPHEGQGSSLQLCALNYARYIIILLQEFDEWKRSIWKREREREWMNQSINQREIE